MQVEFGAILPTSALSGGGQEHHVGEGLQSPPATSSLRDRRRRDQLYGGAAREYREPGAEQTFQQRLPVLMAFQAEGDWGAFQRRFLAHQEMSGWTDAEALRALPATLNDDALATLMATPRSDRSTLHAALQLMARVYGPPSATSAPSEPQGALPHEEVFATARSGTGGRSPQRMACKHKIVEVVMSKLMELGALIEDEAIAYDEKGVADMSNELDREDEATPVLDDKAPVVLVHSAVLQTQTLVPLGRNLALGALVQIVQPDDAPSTKPPREKIRPVVAVSRRGTPLVEWDENDEILMGAFPTLFMLGKVPPASDYEAFVEVAERKAILTGWHSHGFTCEKGKRGKYMCRLSMGRGVHDHPSCPLLLTMHKNEDISKGIRCYIEGREIDAATIQFLERPLNHLNGVLLRPHLRGPIVRELHRPEQDAMFVESNIIATNLLGCHNNSSIISGQDAGEAVEEYKASYMTKGTTELRQATALLLAAVDEIHAHPSRADDSGTKRRTGKHLATRTVNAFSGGAQWSLPLMAYALLGHTSHITSESFRYVFANENVAYIAHCLKAKDDVQVDASQSTEVRNDNLYAEACLDELFASVDCNEKSADFCGGTAAYVIGDKRFFLSQAESYAHRGQHFQAFSQLEFECIVELVPKRKPGKEYSGRGRPSRRTFPLGSGHKLFDHYDGVIRTKIKTAMLAGSHPPLFPGNKPDEDSAQLRWYKDMDELAKYVMALLTPWGVHNMAATMDHCSDGLCQLFNDWNCSTASLVNRQRLRYIQNIMSKVHRSSRNEVASSRWRERNADWWANLRHSSTVNCSVGSGQILPDDAEAMGRISHRELQELTTAASAGDNKMDAALKTLRDNCFALHGSLRSLRPHAAASCVPDSSIVYQDHHSATSTAPDLLVICKSIHSMTISDATATGSDSLLGGNGPSADTNSLHASPPVARSSLTEAQLAIVKFIMDDAGQKLCLMHAGGGTGKSFIINHLQREHEHNNKVQVNCCPTGTGAIKLPNGRTFHMVFKAHQPNLTAGQQMDAIARILRIDHVKSWRTTDVLFDASTGLVTFSLATCG
ncbi:unnamed protein product [Lampetra planeri]